MATEDEGPAMDVSVLMGMMCDERRLADLPRGHIIFVFQGELADPTTLSPWHFGELLGYDRQRKEVHYRTLPKERSRQHWDPMNVEGNLRRMLTDSQSGLLLPAGVRESMGEENRVRLDESYIIVDGAAYAQYMAAQQNPGDDLYDK